MYKIAILGCENSHADAFINLIKNNEKYADIEVVGVYSNEPEAMQKLNEKYGVYMASDYTEFVGKVDGIMITARHGANHYKYAKPYISSGIPMFIDKPITCDEAEAVQFMKELKANGVRVTGGSTCIHVPYVKELKKMVEEKEQGAVYGGYLRAPVDMESVHGGFYFYAAHLTQITQEIFGRYPTSVSANVNAEGNLVVVKYPEYNVAMQYVNHNYVYYASVSAKNGVFGGNVAVSSAIYFYELDNFHKLLHGGEMENSYKDFISSVYVISAIDRSIKSGKEEAVNPVEEI